LHEPGRPRAQGRDSWFGDIMLGLLDQLGIDRTHVVGNSMGGRTHVELRLSYVVAGAGLSGWLAERIAAPTVSAHVRRTLEQLERLVAHEQLRMRAARRRSAVGP